MSPLPAITVTGLASIAGGAVLLLCVRRRRLAQQSLATWPRRAAL
ncbi:MAG TPA: hypothetical protein VGN37_04440 [Actinocatenispora sp.]